MNFESNIQFIQHSSETGRLKTFITTNRDKKIKNSVFTGGSDIITTKRDKKIKNSVFTGGSDIIKAKIDEASKTVAQSTGIFFWNRK